VKKYKTKTYKIRYAIFGSRKEFEGGFSKNKYVHAN
jgi:hypothetical protein